MKMSSPLTALAAEDDAAETQVRVSVVMANYRGAAYLGAAMESVLRQSMAALELVVVDDASPDDSVALARDMAGRDARVRVVEAGRNGGPAAARNLGLSLARGTWVAVMDSDDLMHPARLERMLMAAARTGADMVADDMIFFGAALPPAGRSLLGTAAPQEPMTVSPAMLLRAGLPGSGVPPLGYLKPLIRRAAIGDMRYDTALRIGEDHDFYMRLLLAGGRFVVMPEALYQYRRHGGSISHRLGVAPAKAMLAAHRAMANGLAPDVPFAADLAARTKMLERTLAYETLVATIKARRLPQTLGQIAARPGLLSDLGQSTWAHLRRKWARREAAQPGDAPQRMRSHSVLLIGPGRPPPEIVVDETIILAPDDPRAMARVAMRLSALAGRQALHLVAGDAAGLDAAWSVAQPARISLMPLALTDPCLPVPGDPSGDQSGHPSGWLGRGDA